MRDELRTVVDQLLATSKSGGEVSLDAIGEAIGARAISQEEIEEVFRALESKSRRIGSPQGGDGEIHLRAVLLAARTLSKELGRKPTVDEIATRSGLSHESIRHALMLAQIMQR